MRERAFRSWGRRPKWFVSLTAGILARFPYPPEESDLLVHLLADARIQEELIHFAREGRRKARHVEIFWVSPQMKPAAVPVRRSLPDLPNTAIVASWLDLTPGQLTCYADLRRLNRFRTVKQEKQHPYRYRWVPKRRQIAREVRSDAEPPAGIFRRVAGWFARTLGIGSPPAAKYRLLEIPKPRLKRAQRKIHDEILSALAPHPAAHGFRHHRSVASNATPHCGQRVVLRFDLSDFFTSVPASRVKGVFLRLGYPPGVARLLTGLCTTWTATDLIGHCYPTGRLSWSEAQAYGRLLERPHLPQGAPTSPALANLCAYRLDCRLAGLAEKLGANYTRYADDLTFSGGDELRRAASRVRRLVAAIAAEEGFTINVRKSRVMPRGTRQTVAGVVVNEKPNVRRADFDRLKAILTNCVRHGPTSQNREKHPDFRGHLTGRVAHVAMLNPARGAKLRVLLNRIDWSR